MTSAVKLLLFFLSNKWTIKPHIPMTRLDYILICQSLLIVPFLDRYQKTLDLYRYRSCIGVLWQAIFYLYSFKLTSIFLY